MKKAMMMLMFLLLLLISCGKQEGIAEENPPNKFMTCWEWWFKTQVSLGINETYSKKYAICRDMSQICVRECLEEGNSCDRSYEVAKKECIKD